MIAVERFSYKFSQKLIDFHLFTLRLVQHCTAISATDELLFTYCEAEKIAVVVV